VNDHYLSSPHPLSSLTALEFGLLLAPHQREIQVHCYRMMGTVQDAEDMAQETFLRAWQRRDTFAGRSSLRAWLYKIATNLCLDTLKKQRRRAVPVTYQAVSSLVDPIPASVMEPVWLDPYPDELLLSGTDTPEKHIAAQENTKLAFIVALHLLPPRQRAILMLRDVLEWEATEVAIFLDCSVSAVKSALHRARATLAHQQNAWDSTRDEFFEMQMDPQQLNDYLLAWEQADIPAFVKLLKEDATFSMPPIPAWYQGRKTIGGLVGKTIFAGQAKGRWWLLSTRANRQPAFGLYRQNDENSLVYDAYGIQVVTIKKDEISDITTFRNPALIPYFNLPTTLTKPL
jgi:RNA polymerase sigma-70 factor (ECF subfamily)